MSVEERRRAQQPPGSSQKQAVPTWTRALLAVLVLGALADLWWAIVSGEPAAWAIFFSLVSMVISVSGWAVRRRQQGRSRER